MKLHFCKWKPSCNSFVKYSHLKLAFCLLTLDIYISIWLTVCLCKRSQAYSAAYWLLAKRGSFKPLLTATNPSHTTGAFHIPMPGQKSRQSWDTKCLSVFEDISVHANLCTIARARNKTLVHFSGQNVIEAEQFQVDPLLYQKALWRRE